MSLIAAAAAKVFVSESKIEWLRQRPYLCVSPYSKTDFRFHSNGFHASCCCNLDVKHSVIEGSTVLLDQVRHSMSEKTTHPACWRCFQEESLGHVSERVSYLMHHSMDELEAFDQHGISVHEIEIGAKISNLCNLACRSCQPYDSSLWSKIAKIPVDYPVYEQDLSDHDRYWNVLLDHITAQSQIHDTLIVHPIGGETLLQKGFHRLIDWFMEQRLHDRTTFRITTNFATAISDLLAEKLTKFRKVELLASIDSVGENYHYVRWPAGFDKVTRNLETMKRLHDTYPDRFPVLTVVPIFSLNNIFYIEDVLDFWSDWTDSSGVPINLNTRNLYRPDLLCIEILPERYRSVLIEILKRCLDHRFFVDLVTPEQSSAYAHISSTLERLSRCDTANENTFRGYLRFCADYDKRTGQSSHDGNQRLFGMLDDLDVMIYQQHFETTDISLPMYVSQL